MIRATHQTAPRDRCYVVLNETRYMEWWSSTHFFTKICAKTIVRFQPTVTFLLWTPAQRKRESMLYVANVFYLFFLWPPYSPALVNGGSRNFYT